MNEQADALETVQPEVPGWKNQVLLDQLFKPFEDLLVE